MSKSLILVLVFVLAAGAGTNAELISTQEVSNQQNFGIQNYGEQTIKALIGFFYRPQNGSVTKFGMEMISSQMCKFAEGDLRLHPRWSCTDPRGGNTAIVPDIRLKKVNIPTIGTNNNMDTMEKFKKYSMHLAPKELKVGEKVVRVYRAAWDIMGIIAHTNITAENAEQLANNHGVRRLIYLKCNDCRIPSGTLRLEVHKDGLCMSSNAVSKIVTEALTTQDVKLELYMNKHEYRDCFEKYIEKFLQNDALRFFVNMSLTPIENKTAMIDPWLAAVESVSELCEGHNPVCGAVQTLLHKAVNKSGVCLNLTMDSDEEHRLIYRIQSSPDNCTNDLLEKLQTFKCGSGKNVNGHNKTKEIITRLMNFQAESNTNPFKATFSMHRFWLQCKGLWVPIKSYMNGVAGTLHTKFGGLLGTLCESMHIVAWLCVIGSIYWWVGKSFNIYRFKMTLQSQKRFEACCNWFKRKGHGSSTDMHMTATTARGTMGSQDKRYEPKGRI